MRRIETFDWWPELVELKDELSLRELADKFNVTPGAISAALRRTGITRKPAPPGPRARRTQLPPEPGGEGNPPLVRPGSKDSQLVPYLDELGQVPDAEVANRAGVSVRTVASFRSRHDIPGYSGPRRRRKDRKPRRSRIDPYKEMLGQVPDRVVAEQAGVSLNAVRNYRVKHGIAASGRGRPKAGTVPPPGSLTQAPPPPTDGQIAWEVTLASGESVAVLAPDLVSAAEAAKRAGAVSEIRRVGRVV
jgi:hypothetical protein